MTMDAMASLCQARMTDKAQAAALRRAQQAAQQAAQQQAQQQAKAQAQQGQEAQKGSGANQGCQPKQPQLSAQELGQQHKERHQAGQNWQGFAGPRGARGDDTSANQQKAMEDQVYQCVCGADAAKQAQATGPKAVDPTNAARDDGAAPGATHPARNVRGRQSPAVQRAADAAAEVGRRATTPDARPANGAPRTDERVGEKKDYGQGAQRKFRGFREVSEEKLKQALPKNAQHLAKSFIEAGRKHNIDPVMLAAISKHETGNFTSSAFRNKNNAMGISGRNGPLRMSSAEASIDKMAKHLADPKGYYKNAQNIADLAKVYAPKGAANDPTGLNSHWPRGVAKYADQIERMLRS